MANFGNTIYFNDICTAKINFSINIEYIIGKSEKKILQLGCGSLTFSVPLHFNLENQYYSGNKNGKSQISVKKN